MGKAEAKIENYLKKQAEAAGFLCYKFTSPGNDGVPDRILIGHGQTVFVETKSPTGTVRPLQKNVIQTMRNHGAIVYVINSHEQVDQLLPENCSKAPRFSHGDIRLFFIYFQA